MLEVARSLDKHIQHGLDVLKSGTSQGFEKPVGAVLLDRASTRQWKRGTHVYQLYRRIQIPDHVQNIFYNSLHAWACSPLQVYPVYPVGGAICERDISLPQALAAAQFKFNRGAAEQQLRGISNAISMDLYI